MGIDPIEEQPIWVHLMAITSVGERRTMISLTIPANGQRIRVLLMDENPVFMRAATAFLQRQEWLVVLRTAAKFEAALVGARDFQPAVIVLDPSTSGLGGLGIIPRLRTVLSDVGIVVLALIDSTTYQDASIAVGANGFVSKSSMVIDLLPAIRRAARTRANAYQGGGLLTSSTLRKETIVGQSVD